MLHWGQSFWHLAMRDLLGCQEVWDTSGIASQPKGGPWLCIDRAKRNIYKLHICALIVHLSMIFFIPFMFSWEGIVPYLFLARSLHMYFLFPRVPCLRSHTRMFDPILWTCYPPIPSKKFPLWSPSQEKSFYNGLRHLFRKQWNEKTRQSSYRILFKLVIWSNITH